MDFVQTDLVMQDISEPGDAVRAHSPPPTRHHASPAVRQSAQPRANHIPTRAGWRPQVELFGASKGVIVCAPGRPLRPWFTVPDGCYALVTRFGKDEDYAGGHP